MRCLGKVLVAPVIAGAVVAAVPGARADECATYEVEYLTAANLELRDTPMGAGNGIYRIGPGRAVIRFAGRDAKLVAYEMRERFVITSKALFWETRVTTDAMTRTTPDACGVVAEGSMSDRTLRWATPVRGYHTDGKLVCDGSLCGKLGAPPSGASELHIPPHAVAFGPLTFSADRKTFTMPNTEVSKSDAPKQTAFIALSGREARRTCVAPPPCP